jgi:branched-chain amino acid transport system substrate-binding protein
MVGSSFSRNAIPSGEVAERAGIPMISPGSTHPRTTAGRRYVFRVAFVDSFQGRVMARFARDRLGFSTAAVLYDVADAYSRNIAELFRRVFEEAGGRVVAFEPFTSGESDFRPQLERIRDAEPEAVFLPNFTADLPAQGRQLRRLGIDAVLLGSDSWLAELARHPELDGAFFTRSWHHDLAGSSPEAEAFRERYRQLHGSEPDEQAALTYDAFGLLFAALADAPRPAPEAIREALARIDGYRGLTGPISYRGRGGDPMKNVAIVRIEDGEIRLFELVEPETR